MSEPLRKPASPIPRTAIVGPLVNPIPPGRAAEDNDNAAAAPLREGERRGFEIPAAIWWVMVGCYAVFLAELWAATGGSGYAVFMIAISLIYVIMFFGTTRVMIRQSAPRPRSPLDVPGWPLQTICGPLGRGEVVAQMLVVPLAIAFFGLAVLTIRTLVM